MALSSERPIWGSLTPIEIKVAALAYESVLKSLDGVADDPSTRDRVARDIMERMLEGERDLIRIQDGALAHLQRRVEISPGAKRSLYG